MRNKNVKLVLLALAIGSNSCSSCYHNQQRDDNVYYVYQNGYYYQNSYGNPFMFNYYYGFNNGFYGRNSYITYRNRNNVFISRNPGNIIIGRGIGNSSKTTSGVVRGGFGSSSHTSSSS